jgi:hypothetical protein
MSVVLDTIFEHKEPHLLQVDHIDVSGLMLLPLIVWNKGGLMLPALTVYETRLVLCYQL